MANPTNNDLLDNLADSAGASAATFDGGVFLLGYTESLASGTSFDIGLTTDVNEIVFDPPVVTTNSGDVSFTIYEGATFTGGTNLPAYLNDRNSTLVPDITALVSNPTISVLGSQASPTYKVLGDNNAGRGTTTLGGRRYILKPMTSYVLRVTHNASNSREVTLDLAAYRRR